MVDPQTVNKFLNQPLSGSDVGVWDVPVNANMGIVDNSFGGLATIALAGSPVALSSTQYQCAFLRFTGALSASVGVTFPNVGSFYTIINDTTNSSAFCVVAGTTVAGSRVIGLPPGSMTEIMTDGSNVRYRTLPPVGTYLDFAGSSTPLWVDSCTVPPFLNCNATTFSSATYPALAVLLGGNTLPDSRGRSRIALDAGVGRVSSAASGVAGNTLLAGGGDQNIGAHSHSVIGNTGGQSNDHTHTTSVPQPTFACAAGGLGTTFTAAGVVSGGVSQDHSHAINFASQVAGSGVGANMPPVYVGGITMVRAG